MAHNYQLMDYYDFDELRDCFVVLPSKRDIFSYSFNERSNHVIKLIFS